MMRKRGHILQIATFIKSYASLVSGHSGKPNKGTSVREESLVDSLLHAISLYIAYSH